MDGARALIDMVVRRGAAVRLPTLEGLREVTRRWLFAQPFHNLDLLAASLGDRRSLTREEAIDRCARGLGGPCHVQAAGFFELVTLLGFEADLVGATINSRDDHLLVRVQLGGRYWLCDVGNGQPYVEPFPADSILRFAHLGWEFETRPIEGGVELRRTSPDQPTPRTVYRASLERRAWTDFAQTIDRHHREPGFGPFLAGLRAVRMGADEMAVLRDTALTVYRTRSWDRVELAVPDLAVALRGRLGLADLPVEDALEAWCRTRQGAP